MSRQASKQEVMSQHSSVHTTKEDLQDVLSGKVSRASSKLTSGGYSDKGKDTDGEVAMGKSVSLKGRKRTESNASVHSVQSALSKRSAEDPPGSTTPNGALAGGGPKKSIKQGRSTILNMGKELEKLEDVSEKSDSDGCSSDEDDEATIEAHLEVMRKARQSTRMTLAPERLVESVTSRWSHFSENMVVQLIEGKADVHARLQEPWDRSFEDYVQTIGATTLHFAARRGLLEVCKTLVEYRAEVNDCTSQGITPIMVAVIFNQQSAVKLLFNSKASVMQRDKSGLCAVDLAVLENRHEMHEMISKFEEEEDRLRTEKVRNEFEVSQKDDCSDNEAEVDNEGLDDDSPRDGSPRRSADGSPRRRSAEFTPNTLRSPHLLPVALKKHGISVPPSQAAIEKSSASVSGNPGGRKGQTGLLVAQALTSSRRVSYRGGAASQSSSTLGSEVPRAPPANALRRGQTSALGGPIVDGASRGPSRGPSPAVSRAGSKMAVEAP